MERTKIKKSIINMKTIFKIICIFITGSLSQHVFTQEKIPDKYLVEAGENNPGPQAAYREYYAALEKVPQAGSLPDPKVSFGYFISPVETRLGPQQFKVSLSQMFPWFGTLEAQKKAFAEKAQIQYQQFVNRRNGLYRDVKIRWYEIYKAHKALEITKENLDVLHSLKQITVNNYETGKTKMTDILRLDVNIREQENSLKDLEQKYVTTQAEFNLLLNKNEEAAIEVPSELSLDSFNLVSYRDSIRNHPELSALMHKEKSLQHQYETAVKKGYPGISLALDYAVIGERTDMQVNNNGQDVIMPMIGISIPIYRKKYNAMKKEKEIQLQAVQYGRQNRLNMLSSQYKNAEEKYMDAMRKVELYRQQTNETQRIYNLLKTSYSADGENFYELLKTRLMVLEYELKMEIAKADQNIAVATLEYLTNKK
jgi:outer membrane protein, heavy metal efflux system